MKMYEIEIHLSGGIEMMMKRTLSLLLAVSMMSSMASGAFAANVVPEESRVPANVMTQSAYENL